MVFLQWSMCKEKITEAGESQNGTRRRNRTAILPSGGECTIHYAMQARLLGNLAVFPMMFKS